MFGRRILVLVLVLMGLTALAASLTPPPQPLHRTRPVATPATPTPTAPPSEGQTVTAHLTTGGRVRHVAARTGDLIQLDVSGDAVDTVVNDDLAISDAIAPGSPVQILLFADAAGSYPITLLDSGRRIGVLRISPS